MDKSTSETALPAYGSAWPSESPADCPATDRYLCTRIAGHDGPHVAQGSRNQVLHAWHDAGVTK